MEHFDNIFLTYGAAVYDWLNQPGYGSLCMLSFLASTLLPIGSEWLLVLMLVKGYPVLSVVMTATIGNYFGALVTCLIGRWGGQWIIRRVLRIPSGREERTIALYRRYGVYTLFFSWLPFIGDAVCLVGGMMRVNMWLFTFLVGTGKLLRYAAVAWATVEMSV